MSRKGNCGPWPQDAFGPTRTDRIVREAVRDELQKANQSKKGLVGFMNSPFGLLLFSSIVIGGISAGYTRYTTASDAREASRQRLIKLSTELTFRIMRVMESGAALSSAEDDELELEKIGNDIRSKLYGNGDYNFGSPEFEGVSFITLAKRLDAEANIPSKFTPKLDMQFAWLTMGGKAGTRSYRMAFPEMRAYAVNREQAIRTGDLPTPLFGGVSNKLDTKVTRTELMASDAKTSSLMQEIRSSK